MDSPGGQEMCGMSEHKRSKLELEALAAATACLREATLLEAEPMDLTAADIYRAMAELITDNPQATARAFVLELSTTIGVTI